MNPSIFLTITACIAETKQNCPTDTEKRNSRCSWITMKCRQGQRQKQSIPEAAVMQISAEMGTDPLKGLQDSTDDKSFTEYLKTRKMQTLLSSAKSGCQKSAAEVLMGWWQKREKAGGWIGNSKTNGDWSAPGRWQISQWATKGDVRERRRDTPGSRWRLCSWETQRASSLRCRLQGPATQLAHLDSPMPSGAEGGWAIIPCVSHLLGTVLYLYMGSSSVTPPQIGRSGKQYHLDYSRGNRVSE